MLKLLRAPALPLVVLVLPSAVLAGWLVWEQTIDSWRHGPQAIGAALLRSGLSIPLYLCLLGAVVWAITVLLMAAFAKRVPRASSIVGAIVALACAGLISVPYGSWVRMSAPRIAQGTYASEFLVYMATLGQTDAVRALLDQGVPVDAQAANGFTAAQAARLAKKTDTLELLSARGGH